MTFSNRGKTRRVFPFGAWVLCGAALVGGLASLTSLTACGTFDYGDAPVDEVEVSTTNPNFLYDIKPLMTLKCMNCHTTKPSSFVPPDTPPIALDNEAKFKELADRVRIRTFEKPDDPMPPPYGTPLTENERKALKKYLDDLKAAATPAPTATAGGTTVTLSAAYQATCVGCHGAQGESTTYKKLAGTSLTEAQFIAKVREGPGSMPDFNSSVISDADLKADYAKLKTLR